MTGLQSTAASPSSTHQKLRILYTQPNTRTYAGMERVIDEICTQLAQTYRDEFDIDVFYPSRYDGYEIGDRPYRKIEIDATTRLGFMRTVRQIVAETPYDVVVVPQVEGTVVCWVACLGLKKTFVAYLHGNPRLERSHFKAKVLFFLMHWWVLDRLAAVFGTSPRQLAAFKTMFRRNVTTRWVPNPVRPFASPELKGSTPPLVTFVNVARFAYQKGQDILIGEFAQVHRARPHTRLRLVGYGDGEAGLREAIARFGLQDVVSIEHLPDNPRPALESSDVYVSPSRWEGWSLAICEALRFGLPVVSTDCEFGPSDILTDERLGRLVPTASEGALAKAMIYYCDNLAAEKDHAQFRKDHIDQYSVARVVHAHGEALKDAARQPRLAF